MVVVMDVHSTQDEIELVNRELVQMGLQTQQIRGSKKIVIGAMGEASDADLSTLALMPGVEKIIPIMKPYKLASREAQAENTMIQIKNTIMGNGSLVVIAGPCAVENEEQICTAAQAVKESGAQILRGGAFKPRTSPYAFQGLQKKGLKLLRQASFQTGLPVVTEVIDEHSLEMALDYVDILQIGARNMQNFHLLKAAGNTDKAILLKRGMSATIEKWLMAAEYIMTAGNQKVILCERGIRTFETYTRNTLDLSAIPAVKRLSHLPIIVDPSHATGDRHLVPPMALAAFAGGADGLMIEMHPDPPRALSDGPQSLRPEELSGLMKQLTSLASVLGRSIPTVEEVISHA